MGNSGVILRVTNEKLWFNGTEFIDVQQTNIPIEHLRFRTHREIYWKVKMKEFDKTLGKLSVDVISYDWPCLSAFLNQKPKYESKWLDFGKFEWKSLERNLSSYTRNKFKQQLMNDDDKSSSLSRGNQFPYADATKKTEKDLWGDRSVKSYYYEPNIVPVTKELTSEFAISFSDCSFMLGHIAFSKHIPILDKRLDFQIENENILTEFDNVKQWFSKKLRINEFKVRVNFTFVNNELHQFSVTSEDIDRIDQSLIESIKVERTLAIVKSERSSELNSSFFTSENLYSLENARDLKSNVFQQTDKDILDTLIKYSDVRNKRELNYLSSSIQSLNYKIRFTCHPCFGFIFLAEGKSEKPFRMGIAQFSRYLHWAARKLTTKLIKILITLEKEETF